MKTKAAVLYEMGAPQPYVESLPLVVDELTFAGPGPDEVLVEIAGAGLCHSDLSVVNGSRPRRISDSPTLDTAMRTLLSVVITLAALLAPARIPAQDKNTQPTNQDIEQLEKTFAAANTLMEQHKYAEALARYKEALALAPDEPAILFNGGLAAYQSKNFDTAADLWQRLKKIDPADWHTRAKLVQAYQALGKLPERDAERAELFGWWKSGDNPELSKQVEYCREQFEVSKFKVMAFEHFELKGERALRYVFSILNEKGDAEDFRISLGSYEMTNAIWRETTNPKPKPGERLFHLDGYFKWGHATYGMYAPEPSYEQVRASVVKILEEKAKPIAATTINPSAREPAPKPKP
jgi:tetratricopeptide (TPR) repeat protein